MRKLDPVKHEEKRREILNAAERCFVRDGLQGASISSICAEARISPGHLYHYFASKEAIVSAMIEVRLEEAAARFAKLAEGADVLSALFCEIEVTRSGHPRLVRSEEHTSELQSLMRISYAVFCLKNKKH